MSTKRLRSVIQSTAHHAVSGLCYVHPHLGSQCKDLGIKSVRVGLLEPSFDPSLGDIPKELSLSTNALREKFDEILASEHISRNEIKDAYATFEFLQAKWPVGCCVSAYDLQGKKIEAAVGSDGNSAEVLRGHS
jgi:hypothetical protein